MSETHNTAVQVVPFGSVGDMGNLYHFIPYYLQRYLVQLIRGVGNSRLPMETAIECGRNFSLKKLRHIVFNQTQLLRLNRL